MGQIAPDLQLRTYALPIPEDLRAYLAAQDSVRLELRGPTWAPAAAGLPDPRELSVVLSSIAVR